MSEYVSPIIVDMSANKPLANGKNDTKGHCSSSAIYCPATQDYGANCQFGIEYIKCQLTINYTLN